ncbi:hypothetical protein HPB52_004125 [Rhipicephalus sanguineus]|uniref:Uncharacterized protein n=1 Tax=Rhipicephalus sanguineus TaxID=34632 RepID=A0A9D4T6Z9_RHISA|nr:hypothetical protein HPB52_004125 [Rhipicephalus sanguineus]
MLRHYEKECTFHAVECTRCGEEILHGNLSTHYVTECVTGAPPASAVNTSSQSRETILQGVGAALQEFKTLLTKANYEETLPAIQSCLNELLEKVRNQESRMAEVYREVGGNAETAQNAARTTSTSKQEPASRRTPKTSIGTEASTSSSSLSCPQNRVNHGTFDYTFMERSA